jgi:hypothetical protein
MAKSNNVTNLKNCPLSGFYLRYVRIIQTNGQNFEVLGDFPQTQSIYGFKENKEIIEYKYQKELQEKATIFEVPLKSSNIGDYKKSFCYIINMDPTYDASLGNTTLLNGQTNASLRIGLNCIDPTFNGFNNLIVRVYKITEYQLSLNSVGQASVVQFPASVGANQTPIIPAQVNQPQV